MKCHYRLVGLVIHAAFHDIQLIREFDLADHINLPSHVPFYDLYLYQDHDHDLARVLILRDLIHDANCINLLDTDRIQKRQYFDFIMVFRFATVIQLFLYLNFVIDLGQVAVMKPASWQISNPHLHFLLPQAVSQVLIPALTPTLYSFLLLDLVMVRLQPLLRFSAYLTILTNLKIFPIHFSFTELLTFLTFFLHRLFV